MLKKISIVFAAFVLFACSSTKPIQDEGGADNYADDVVEIGISNSRSFRVGMLLPLTGADAKYGQGMKNASLLALNDIKNPNVVIQYYDTASTPAGARVAIKNATAQRAQLILGPLKSTEVSAISNETIYQGVPVVAFSTSPEVLQPTIYTLGLLIDEQIDRIITYAVKQGRRNFALLLPDNNTGISVARAAVKAANKNQVAIKLIAFYPQGISDFSALTKQVIDSGITFDAMLIPEGGITLTAATAMFAYYDKAYPDVLFLGSSIWEAGISAKETSLQNSVYPSLTKAKGTGFVAQYYSVFGEKPSSLYTLAYDAVILADKLSKATDDNLLGNITSLGGFQGLNGKVRFFADGTNQHSLDIISVDAQGGKVVDSGDSYFETINEALEPIDPDTIYSVPHIIGKDSSLAQILIYGKTIDFIPQSDNFTSMSVITTEQNSL